MLIIFIKTLKYDLDKDYKCTNAKYTFLSFVTKHFYIKKKKKKKKEVFHK